MKYNISITNCGENVVRANFSDNGSKNNYSLDCHEFMKSLKAIPHITERYKDRLVQIYDSTMPETEQSKQERELLYSFISDVLGNLAIPLPKGSKLELSLEVPEENK
jgi:hypothetical protein